VYGTAVGQAATWFFVYSAVILSFVRGLPVVYDSWDYLRGQAPEQQRLRQQFLEARRLRREQDAASVSTPERRGE
jgi:hypothetical protein